MHKLLSPIKIPPDPRVIIGNNLTDDAGVFMLDNEKTLVFTNDFFTPIVDDPYDYGRISAANALSDIYAMGGIPVAALNICAIPPNIPIELYRKVIEGGISVCIDNNVAVVGGHTIKSPEMNYGLAVIGTVNPQKILSKSKAKPGDVILLTKPLGTGILSTALKKDNLPDDKLKEITELMAKTNKIASYLSLKHNANSATDITGFGLLGHAFEMAEFSDVSIEIYFSKVPFISSVQEFFKRKFIPGGLKANFEYFKQFVKSDVDDDSLQLLSDPQTSGGLLISLPEENSHNFLNEIKSRGEFAWIIGKIIIPSDKRLIIKN